MKTTNTSHATRASRLPRTVRLAVFGLFAFGLAFAATSFATIPGNAAENPNEMVELRIKLPAIDMPQGGPSPVIIENLDRSMESQRKPLFIPKNANQNIASKKPVTSEAKVIEGELNYITDGDKDEAEGFEVELEPGLQWVQIDLQKHSEIFAIALWHFYRRKRAYRNVIIQISDDPKFKRGVTTVFNTDSKNTVKFGAGKDKHYIETVLGKLIPVSGVKGRYVRLYSQGNTSNPGNHYIEVEVYGRDANESPASPDAPIPRAPRIENWKELKITPAPSGTKKIHPIPLRIENFDKDSYTTSHPVSVPEDSMKNVAFKSLVTSSAKIQRGELAFITDGKKEGAETAEVRLEPGLQWVQIDLGDKIDIYAIALWHSFLDYRAYRDVIIQISNDPEFISDVETVFNNDIVNTSGFGWGKDKLYAERAEGKLIPVEGLRGRYVRLYSRGNTQDGDNRYVEVEVYGRPAVTPAVLEPRSGLIAHGRCLTKIQNL